MVKEVTVNKEKEILESEKYLLEEGIKGLEYFLYDAENLCNHSFFKKYGDYKRQINSTKNQIDKDKALLSDCENKLDSIYDKEWRAMEKEIEKQEEEEIKASDLQDKKDEEELMEYLEQNDYWN